MDSCNLVERSRERSYEIASTFKRGTGGVLGYFSKDLLPTIDVVRAKSHELPTAPGQHPGHVTEKISDQVLPERAKRLDCYNMVEDFRKSFKNVEHERSSYSVVGQPEAIMAYCSACTGISNIWMFTDKSGTIGVKDFYQPRARFLTEHLAHEFTSRDLSAAFARLKPNADNLFDKVSLPNFAIELKDLKRLTQLLKVPKDLKSASADKFVGTNFGVLPVISDIKKLVDLVGKVDDFLLKWNEMADKKTTMNYHTTAWNFADSEEIKFSQVDGDFLVNGSFFRNKTNIAKAHVYITPRRLPDGISLSLKARTLGFDKPLSVIWEAIPFSWFIDYFLNIQDILDSLSSQESLFKFDIVSAGYSTLWEDEIYSSIEGELNPLPSHFNSVWNYSGTTVWDTKRHYTRKRVSPEAARVYMRGVGWEISPSLPSPHQLMLSIGVGVGLR